MLKKINELDLQRYSFRLHNIVNTTIHMHDAYEIIFLLRGSVDLKCTAFNYHLTEGDIFIINVKELHQFSNGSGDNLILMLHFDPYAYHHIVPDLDFYFFVCDSYDSVKKDDPRLLAFQQILIQFALSSLDEKKDEREPEEHMLSLISFMISNYQSYFATPHGYKSNTSLKNRDYQTDRIREIQNYLYSNSRSKITLDDLAEHLHLNKYYVSHLCKSIIGLSMTDFLSLIRVEQSEFLLLSTDMSVEQIAFEYGFSAKRYYEKHFFKWHGTSPSEYRKLVLNSREEQRRPMELSSLSTNPIRNLLKKYTSAAPSSSIQSASADYKLNLDADGQAFLHFWEESVTLSDPYRCLNYLSFDVMAQAKQDLSFTKIRLKNIFAGVTETTFSPESLNRLFDILRKLDIDIIISVSFPKSGSSAFCRLVARFFDHMRLHFDEALFSRLRLELINMHHQHIGARKLHDLTERHIEDLEKSAPGVPVSTVEYAEELNQFSHNSMLLLPHIINTCMQQNADEALLYRELYDCTPDLGDTAGRLYHNNCLLTERMEKTPLYYLWEMMSQLGDALLFMRPGIIATKKGRSYRILLYAFSSEDLYKTNDHSDLFQLYLTNVKTRYIATAQYLDSERCLFQQRSGLGFPKTLPLQIVECLNRATAPSIAFEIIEGGKLTSPLQYTMHPASVLLLTLTPATQ